jgi:DNA-binding transcriptional LysR family regulator
MALMLDLRLIEAFLAVADAQSFSRAAEQIEAPQSAVSTRVRRLEDLVGFAVFSRTSRHVNLTAQGLAFLPYARAMWSSETEARAAAREIAKNQGRRSLRIGSYHFLTKARSKLIGRYLKASPDTEILVQYGTREELFRQLRRGDLDLVLGLAAAVESEPGLKIHNLGRLFAHMAIPPEDPLHGVEEITLSMLAGRKIAVMPCRTDRTALRPLVTLLANYGVRVVSGPETEKDAIDAYARARGLIHFAWFGRRRTWHLDQLWAVVPINDERMSIHLAAVASDQPAFSAIEDFVAICC